MKLLLGVSGQAGSGKDTVADYSVGNHRCVKIALADPIKRIAREIYDFSVIQLWGASQFRNEPDKRYPREHTWVCIDSSGSWGKYQCACCGEHVEFNGDVENDLKKKAAVAQCYLTPRYCLQLIGTEMGRNCYSNTWVDYTLRTARTLMTDDNMVYSFEHGLICRQEPTFEQKFKGSPEYLHNINGVVVSDVRFRNEIDAIHKAGGFVVRVNRPGAGLQGSAGAHRSEAEMREILDDEFDYVIQNIGTLDDLANEVNNMIEELRYKL